MISPRLVDKPLVLYGYGKLGHLAEEIFNELKIPIHAIVERKKITSFEQPMKEDVLVAVCVAIEPYNSLAEYIKGIGFSDIVPVWDIIEAYPEVGIANGWIEQPADRDDHETYKVMVNLEDDLSRRHYGAFMDWRISHYEHRDLVIEVSKSSLPSTLADIRTRQKVETIYIIGGKYPIIIHNEGHELETLKQNIDTFKENRPILHVACYHSRDGLWKIEKFLMDNLPDYRWTFRLTAYMGQAAYIYGTPKERI